jgi:hypothetical protein
VSDARLYGRPKVFTPWQAPGLDLAGPPGSNKVSAHRETIMTRQKFNDGDTVKTAVINNRVRTGTLERHSTQVFIGFPEGDCVFIRIPGFFRTVKRRPHQ